MNLSIVTETAIEELNRLHEEIQTNLRKTVEQAIRAGEILTTVRNSVEHGKFLPWIEANCSFSDKTAEKYMKLTAHRDKIESSSNLQDAYRVVERLETEEKQTENHQALRRVKEFLKTGARPLGWRRGTDDKLAEEERARDERIESHKADMADVHERAEQMRADRGEQRQSWAELEPRLDAALDKISENYERRRTFKDRIRVSQAGESDAFIDALMDYLSELENDNRRIEACQNIIKVCRNVAVELQQEKTEGPV